MPADPTGLAEQEPLTLSAPSNPPASTPAPPDQPLQASAPPNSKHQHIHARIHTAAHINTPTHPHKHPFIKGQLSQRGPCSPIILGLAAGNKRTANKHSRRTTNKH